MQFDRYFCGNLCLIIVNNDKKFSVNFSEMLIWDPTNSIFFC